MMNDEIMSITPIPFPLRRRWWYVLRQFYFIRQIKAISGVNPELLGSSK